MAKMSASLAMAIAAIATALSGAQVQAVGHHNQRHQQSGTAKLQGCPASQRRAAYVYMCGRTMRV